MLLPFGKSIVNCKQKLHHEKNRPRKTGPIFIKCSRSWGRGLLAILLDAGGPQSGKAVLIDGKLPGKEFVDGQRISAARLFEGEQAAANGGDNFGLAANHPPFGPGRGQVRDGERTAVGPDDVFYPRAMGFCHGVLTNSQPLNSR